MRGSSRRLRWRRSWPGRAASRGAYYTILYHTIPYHTIPYHTMIYYTTLRYTILYYTILCYTTILYYTKVGFKWSEQSLGEEVLKLVGVVEELAYMCRLHAIVCLRLQNNNWKWTNNKYTNKQNKTDKQHNYVLTLANERVRVHTCTGHEANALRQFEGHRSLNVVRFVRSIAARQDVNVDKPVASRHCPCTNTWTDVDVMIQFTRACIIICLQCVCCVYAHLYSDCGARMYRTRVHRAGACVHVHVCTCVDTCARRCWLYVLTHVCLSVPLRADVKRCMRSPAGLIPILFRHTQIIYVI